MKAALFLSVLASAAVGLVAAEDLKIDVTAVPIECERKTQKGDKVSMHYRGTLADNGKQFDASTLPWNYRLEFYIDISTGYDRGQPFTFKLGTGQVIKGFVRTIQ